MQPSRQLQQIRRPGLHRIWDNMRDISIYRLCCDAAENASFRPARCESVGFDRGPQRSNIADDSGPCLVPEEFQAVTGLPKAVCHVFRGKFSSLQKPNSFSACYCWRGLQLSVNGMLNEKCTFVMCRMATQASPCSQWRSTLWACGVLALP